MNETWMRELAERHGLADQAGPLMERVSAWLLGQGAGLNDAFAKAGLSAKLSSWLGEGAKSAFTTDDVRTLLGANWVKSTADDLGLETSQVEHGVAEGLPFVLAEVGKALPVAAAPGSKHEPTMALGTSKGPLEWLAWVVLFLAVAGGAGYALKGTAGVAESIESHAVGGEHHEEGPAEPHTPAGVVPGGASHEEPSHGDEPASSDDSQATPATVGEMKVEGKPPVTESILAEVAKLLGPSEMAYKSDGFHFHGSSNPNPKRADIERQVRTLLKGHEVMFHWDLGGDVEGPGGQSEPHEGDHAPASPGH